MGPSKNYVTARVEGLEGLHDFVTFLYVHFEREGGIL